MTPPRCDSPGRYAERKAECSRIHRSPGQQPEQDCDRKPLKWWRAFKGSSDRSDAGKKQADRNREFSGVSEIIGKRKEAERPSNGQAETGEEEQFARHMAKPCCSRPSMVRRPRPSVMAAPHRSKMLAGAGKTELEPSPHRLHPGNGPTTATKTSRRPKAPREPSDGTATVVKSGPA